MNSHLIKPLFKGPLDIIGDVHGELQALDALLSQLGYSDEGEHPEGRKLVFVGDLCDRGPDSPGVIRKVKALIEAQAAQCVLGNHELNILLGKRRQGNHWFEGLEVDSRYPELGTCAPLPVEAQPEILSFFESLPVALEREDIRIVHAAWHESSIELIRLIPDSLKAAFRRIESAIEESKEGVSAKLAAHKAQHALGEALMDPRLRWTAETLALARDIGTYGQLMQLANPIRVITSGLEAQVEAPFFAAGKWRFVTRVPWWERYEGVPVIFGHYWRWYDPKARSVYNQEQPFLFAEDPPFMAADHQTFCVDFSVGGRFKERHAKVAGPFHSRLAALRWPERTIVYDGPHPEPFSS